MISLYDAAILISSVAFLFYGFNCLFSQVMVAEFRRFGLNDGQRKITGILQLIGSLGIGIGYFTSTLLLLIAAAGLCLLMIIGFGVRIKIKDSLLESLPSLIFAIMNAYIVVATNTIMTT